jgi:hypothetical protein
MPFTLLARYIGQPQVLKMENRERLGKAKGREEAPADVRSDAATSVNPALVLAFRERKSQARGLAS